MAEEKEFDTEAAQDRHDRIISEVRRIRNGLTNDVVDWYKDSKIDSAEKERTVREKIRNFLKIARTDIDTLLNGKLY